MNKILTFSRQEQGNNFIFKKINDWQGEKIKNYSFFNIKKEQLNISIQKN